MDNNNFHKARFIVLYVYIWLKVRNLGDVALYTAFEVCRYFSSNCNIWYFTPCCFGKSRNHPLALPTLFHSKLLWPPLRLSRSHSCVENAHTLRPCFQFVCFVWYPSSISFSCSETTFLLVSRSNPTFGQVWRGSRYPGISVPRKFSLGFVAEDR